MSGSVIPQILQYHFEELQFLWSQRQHALKSPDYESHDLLWLEERIAANVDGLLVAADETIPLLDEALLSDETGPSFAAAFVLLRMDPPRTDRVMNELLHAEGNRLAGICQALCHSPINPFVHELQTALISAPAPIAVVAAEVLAYHRALKSPASRLIELLKDEHPEVRRGAWRVFAMMDSSTTQ